MVYAIAQRIRALSDSVLEAEEGSAGAANVFRSVVYGFIPFDLPSFGAGLLLFGAVALVASIAPVRRALRIDPVSALRYE